MSMIVHPTGITFYMIKCPIHCSMTLYIIQVPILLCFPSPDESVPQEPPTCGFFSRCACSSSSLELATIAPNQEVPEGWVGEDERGENEMLMIAVPHKIHLASQRIKANVEMILLTMRRVHHLFVALSLSTWIAKIVKACGND
ncbi:hypothetical protein BDR04DRAFT_1100989 [Suillus decipiens]|nr:hypothetical protein BDR04DRAFT_1100989 [Suillus decipiens]